MKYKVRMPAFVYELQYASAILLRNYNRKQIREKQLYVKNGST